MFSKIEDLEQLLEADDQQPRLVDLIDIEAKTALYHGLYDVDQDEFETLSNNPQGLMSSGFSSCYAVIVKNKFRPAESIALAHVSSIVNSEDDINFFKSMIEAVGTPSEVTIELARSKQSYTEQYHLEHVSRGDGSNEMLNEGDLEPNAFFEEKDPLYLQFFKDHFKAITINPTIYEMPHSIIVIDHLGKIDYLEKHPIGSIVQQEIISEDETYHEDNDSNSEKEDESGYDADNESEYPSPGPNFFKRKRTESNDENADKKARREITYSYTV